MDDAFLSIIHQHRLAFEGVCVTVQYILGNLTSLFAI